MTNFLIEIAPYLAGIISAAVAYMSYRESKRKTQHDDLREMYDRQVKEIKRLDIDNQQLRRENAELRREKKHEKD